MIKTLRPLALVAAISPVAAMGGELSYNYVEGGAALYPSAPADQTWVGATGRFATELPQVHDNVFMLGGIKFLTDDIDYTALHLGGAYRYSLDMRTDLWGGVTIEYQDFDVPSSSNRSGADDTSLGLRGGIRHQVDESLELGGSARVVTGDLDYVGVTGTARYRLDRRLSFLGEVDVFDGDLGLIGGVTYDF